MDILTQQTNSHAYNLIKENTNAQSRYFLFFPYQIPSTPIRLFIY